VVVFQAADLYGFWKRRLIVSDKLTIRHADDDDLTAIADLWKDLMDFHGERDPWLSRSESGHELYKEHIKGLLNEPDILILVAQVENEVVGYCSAEICERSAAFKLRSYALITAIAVNSRWRRQGIAAKLAQEIVCMLYNRGIERVEVSVSTRNEASTAFWQAMGFIPCTQKLYLDVQNAC
jgi:ribosomal protein S18 acetylase RimI-like enzyme